MRPTVVWRSAKSAPRHQTFLIFGYNRTAKVVIFFKLSNFLQPEFINLHYHFGDFVAAALYIKAVRGIGHTDTFDGVIFGRCFVGFVCWQFLN